jgi:hypothetical protein
VSRENQIRRLGPQIRQASDVMALFNVLMRFAFAAYSCALLVIADAMPDRVIALELMVRLPVDLQF